MGARVVLSLLLLGFCFTLSGTTLHAQEAPPREDPDALLTQMQFLLREGLDEQYHQHYDEAREKFQETYVKLLSFKRAAAAELSAMKAAAAFGKASDLWNEIDGLDYQADYQAIPTSLSRVNELKARFKEQLDRLRAALQGAPDWMLAGKLKPYVSGLGDLAGKAAGTKILGTPMLDDVSPYHL